MFSWLPSIYYIGMLEFSQDIESLYVSYGKYHANHINQIIHVVFVPVIVCSAMSGMRHFPLGEETSSLLQAHFGLIPLLGMLGLYLYLDFLSGLISVVVYLGSYLAGNYLYEATGTEHLQYVLIIQAVGWGSQFVGHGVFENRRPALMDNILLTLAAPQFVIIECMFWLGYRPELYQRCKEKIKDKAN
mmetsp:Transcript_4745/g.7145  ORF Transcript_4745/g.7145 Transcript_4745/m.7145 type:complete len:188 (-) Transcript_4745:3971-4534(-)